MPPPPSKRPRLTLEPESQGNNELRDLVVIKVSAAVVSQGNNELQDLMVTEASAAVETQGNNELQGPVVAEVSAAREAQGNNDLQGPMVMEVPAAVEAQGNSELQGPGVPEVPAAVEAQGNSELQGPGVPEVPAAGEAQGNSELQGPGVPEVPAAGEAQGNSELQGPVVAEVSAAVEAQGNSELQGPVVVEVSVTGEAQGNSELQGPVVAEVPAAVESHGNNELQDLVVAEVSVAVGMENLSTPTSCTLTIPPSSSTAYPPFLPVIPNTEEGEKEGEEPTVVALNSDQAPQSPGPSTSQGMSSSGSSNPQVEGAHSLQMSIFNNSSSKDPLNVKMMDLVQLLILKYRLKEPITRAEMLKLVIKGYMKRFPMILKKASRCLEVIFGIELKEVDPDSHSYILVNSLGLTLSNDQGVPKTGLLIIVLGVIFLEGNCAPEENMWEFLSTIGLNVGRKHFIYGDPWNLLTKDWVQENYLVYRKVRNSDPPRWEFLWGPRAYAETNKMKVLDFLARIKGTDPASYSFWYAEALRDEEERARARIALTESTTPVSTRQEQPATLPAPTDE